MKAVLATKCDMRLKQSDAGKNGVNMEQGVWDDIGKIFLSGRIDDFLKAKNSNGGTLVITVNMTGIQKEMIDLQSLLQRKKEADECDGDVRKVCAQACAETMAKMLEEIVHDALL
jgi:hypothetical protein